jgi:Cu+-exporting ATPase
MDGVTVKIGGMHCGACVAHVEKAIRKVPGVRTASVNLATGTGRVEFEPTAAYTPDASSRVVDAVVRAGYTAIPQTDQAPAGATADTESEPDDAAMWRRRTVLGAVLGVPVMVLGMAWMSTTSAWLQFVPATVLQVILGGAFVRGAWRGARSGRVDMDMLVAIGTLSAYGWSVVALLRGDHHVYFDTSVVILTLIALGKSFEARARARAGEAMSGLLALLPSSAAVFTGATPVETPIDRIRVGDEVLVRPGERAPVDGEVLDGTSDVDEALVTGESTPVAKRAGQSIAAGALNLTGALRVRATGVGAGSTVAQVAALVREAQGRKARVQRIADSAAGVFVPVVLVIALGTLLAWGVLGGDWATGTWAAVSVLIVACPCALGLAVPTAVMVGSATGARSGIVIRDPAALERAGGIRSVVLDKTGTLTRGELRLVDGALIEPGLERDRAVALAAALERSSTHPIAQAIIHAAEAEWVEAPASRVVPGVGVLGEVGGRSLGVVAARGASDSADLTADIERLEREGATVVALVDAAGDRPGRTLALLALRDEPRPEAREAVARLRRMGLEPVMLTGDAAAAAKAVADSVGIERVIANVSPADKERIVRELAASGPVAMVGDGMNDAPALAAADIGIAMGSGTHIAASAGHIILVGGDLRALPRAVVLSRAMMRRIRMGLFWAFAYNAVLVPVAAAGWLHPMFAAGAMSLSSVSVVLNALALRRVKLG